MAESTPWKQFRIRHLWILVSADAGLLLITLATTVLTGCVVFLSESATLVGPLPGYDGAYLIRVEQVRGPMTFHGHAGALARTIYVHTIWLPFPPENQSRYSAKDLKIEESEADGKKQVVNATAGTVKVDKSAESVTVDITTIAGKFSGNGEYRLKIQERKFAF